MTTVQTKATPEARERAGNECVVFVVAGQPIPKTDDKEYDPIVWPYVISEDDIVLRLTVEGDPLSKARPRFGADGNIYTPQKTRNYEDAIGFLMRGELRDREPDSKGRYALRCIFYRSNRQRIDCDNLLKIVSDAATAQVWEDDCQVVEVIGRLFLASKHPRTEIVIHRVDNPSPHRECQFCGKEFVTYPSVDSKFCSVDCANKSKRVTVTCRWCGEEFELPQSVAKKRKDFCSRACASSFHGEKRSGANGPSTWKCQDCGGGVSRKEYTRCRACSMKHRSDPTSNYWKLRHKKKAEGEGVA